MTNKTYTISATSGDCYCSKPGTGLFDGASSDLYVAGNGDPNEEFKTWIPFTVPFPKNKTIVSATLRVVATGTDAFAKSVYFGCEAADNPSAPVSNADLQARVMTTANTLIAVPVETVGVAYDFDVTAAAQEILNRAGWAVNNTMAVFVGFGTASARWRRWASVENATYAEPKLIIVAQAFVPSGGMVI